MKTSQTFRLTVASDQVDGFLAACQAASWYAFDTGERVMTEEGADAESVLLVEAAPYPVTRDEITIQH